MKKNFILQNFVSVKSKTELVEPKVLQELTCIFSKPTSLGIVCNFVTYVLFLIGYLQPPTPISSLTCTQSVYGSNAVSPDGR